MGAMLMLTVDAAILGPLRFLVRREEIYWLNFPRLLLLVGIVGSLLGAVAPRITGRSSRRRIHLVLLGMVLYGGAGALVRAWTAVPPVRLSDALSGVLYALALSPVMFTPIVCAVWVLERWTRR